MHAVSADVTWLDLNGIENILCSIVHSSWKGSLSWRLTEKIEESRWQVRADIWWQADKWGLGPGDWGPLQTLPRHYTRTLATLTIGRALSSLTLHTRPSVLLSCAYNYSYADCLLEWQHTWSMFCVFFSVLYIDKMTLCIIENVKEKCLVVVWHVVIYCL